jgi:hypothetical protein
MLAFETDCWDVHESLKSADRDFIVIDVRGPNAFAKGTEEMAFEPTKHVNGRMWQAGQSGNPNGRPVGSRTAFSAGFLKDLAEVWQAHGRETMIKTAKSADHVLCGVRSPDPQRRQAQRSNRPMAGYRRKRPRISEAGQRQEAHRAACSSHLTDAKHFVHGGGGQFFL